MVFRQHIVLLVALMALFFGARAEAMRNVGATNYDTTHYALDCSFGTIDIAPSVVGSLPDFARRLMLAALLSVVTFATALVAWSSRPLFIRQLAENAPALLLLQWGLAAGVISQPPDAIHNKTIRLADAVAA